MLEDQDEKRTISFSGFDAPNYTQVPDQLFDELLTQLSGAELKVLLYIIRRTFGFKKLSDNISLSQMLNGISTKDGQVLDRGVGLSKKTLLQSLNALEEYHIIETERRTSPEKGNEPTTYRLKMSSATEKAEQEKTTPPLGEKLHQGVGGVITPSPRGKNYTTQETVLQETVKQDNNLSNIRRAKPVFENIKNDKPKPTAMPDASIPDRPDRLIRYRSNSRNNEQNEKSNHGFEQISSTIARSRQPAGRVDEDRQVILEYVEDYAREFNDQAPLKSSTTRAYNLFQQSGLPVGTFISKMQEARSVTKESSAQIKAQLAGPRGAGRPAKKKMAYFFACLEDLLGFRDEETRDAESKPEDKTISSVQKSS